MADGNITVTVNARADQVQALLDENARLRAALIDVAAAHAWLAFGDCRAYEPYGHTGAPLQPAEADARVREALGPTWEFSGCAAVRWNDGLGVLRN
jgi:hypothetical protein